MGIPRYGRLDCPWCHNCAGVPCQLCTTLPDWTNNTAEFKRIFIAKQNFIEASLGKKMESAELECLHETTAAFVNTYKKKIENTSVPEVLLDQVIKASVPPPLDIHAPELDCFPPGLSAPLSKNRQSS